MKKTFVYTGLAMSVMLMALTAGAVAVVDGWCEMPTYGYGDPDPVASVEPGHYPYFRYDGQSACSTSNRWRQVKLANGLIEVTAMPEIGGKIWGAKDLVTGRDFLYANDAVKFRDIATRGPWCSGGIEFNFGLTGHAQWTASPVDWMTRTNADGSASYFFGGYEFVTRTFWQVEVNLKDGDDFFTTKLTWHNGSAMPVTRYQWSTSAVTARGEPEMVYPGTHEIDHNGKAHPWPKDAKGVDRSVYTNDGDLEAVSWHVINGDNRFFGIWYPGWKFGMYHRNTAEDKFGRKIFMWSQARSGGIWEDLLTDKAGQYIELQSGRGMQQQIGEAAATPFKFQTLVPGATDVFEEQWGVARDRKLFDEAKKFPSAEIGRPLAFPADYDTNGVYALYRDGEQLMREGLDIVSAEALLKKALAKDPCFVPALGELAALELRRGNFEKSELLAEKALAVDTYDGPANFLAGEIALFEDRLARARERFGVAALDAAYRPAALVRLGMIALREKDYALAGGCAAKALAVSVDDPEAHQLAAVAARLRGDDAAANAAIERGMSRTPLHYGLKYESRLGGGKTELTRCELVNPTLTETALWYRRAGLEADCERILAEARECPIAVLLAGRYDDVAKLPVDFVFPNGYETIAALERAVAAHRSWKFRYYLAIALMPFGETERADRLLEECGNEPDAAVFYLYRAARRQGAKAISDLKHAADLSDSWRVGHALVKTLLTGGDSAAAVATAREYCGKYPGLQQLESVRVEALMAERRFDEAVAVLEKMHVLPSEFNKAIPRLWNRCHRELAIASLAKGDRSAALAHLTAAISFPENLGAGRPVEPLEALSDWPREVRELVEVTSASSMEKIRPRSVASLPETQRLKVRLAQGETEALQLFVKSGADLKRVRVAVSELKRHREGHADWFRVRPEFPADAVKVSVLGYVETKWVPDYKVAHNEPSTNDLGYVRKVEAAEMGWWPDPILDYLSEVDVKAGDRQGFWLSFRASRDVEPGVYAGTVTVFADGKVIRELPLTVRVNAFAVPEKTPLPMAITFCPGPNTQWEEGERLENARRLRNTPEAPCNEWKKHLPAWTDFLADHYMTLDNLYHKGFKRGDERVKELRKLADRGVLDCFNLGYWNYPKTLDEAGKKEWTDSEIARLKESYVAVKDEGVEKYAYLYGCDEIEAKYFENIRWAIGELKREFPGVPLFTTAYDHDYGIGSPLSEMDWFTPLTEPYNPEKAAESRKTGHQVWWYICCGPHAPHANMFIECPAIEGRVLMGAMTAKYRPDGFLYYQTTIWNSERPISGPSAFTDWVARSWTTYHGDGSWVVAGPGGRPMTTVRFENFRDGLEDYAYVKLLEEKLAANPSAPWAAKARELLAVPAKLVSDKTNFTNDPAVLYAWRDALADCIEGTVEDN